MNLLYYCNEYPPYRNGGIGSAVKIVAESMVARGHKVVVAGKYNDNACRKGKVVEECNGVTVVRFMKLSYHTFGIRLKNFQMLLCSFLEMKGAYRSLAAKKNRLAYYRTQQLLENLIQQYKIDLMEVPDYEDAFSDAPIAYPVVQRKFSVPVIMRVHGCASFMSYFRNGKTDEQKERLDKAYFNSVDGICAVSSFSKNYVEEHLHPNKNISVIYNPIDKDWFEGVTENAESNTILFFGKIVETKGAFNLLKAFDSIADKYPDIRLKLVGNGDFEYALSMVSPQHRDRVMMPGFMCKNDLIKEIDAAMFCVLPSYFENFSMAALEVLARKRALIYTQRASGMELLADGKEGFLVEPTDVKQLADCMVQLIEDKNKRNEFARLGHERCKAKFSVNTIIPQLEHYYEQYVG